MLKKKKKKIYSITIFFNLHYIKTLKKYNSDNNNSKSKYNTNSTYNSNNKINYNKKIIIVFLHYLTHA